MSFPLTPASPADLGLDAAALDRLHAQITAHVADGRYPGAQVAVARHGKLALLRSFGDARLDPARVPASDDTLWLLYSNTKVLTACAVWLLAEHGALAFTDRVAAHLPAFEANGKGEITLIQLLSHQAGFPNADMPSQAWDDHELLRKTVCEYALEWAPGSRVHYHGRAAHWTAAALIESVTKVDYRRFIRDEVIVPLGLGDELFFGVPDAVQHRAADMHEPGPDGRPVKRADENNARFRRAGTPGGGGYGTARAMAAFYQMLVNGGPSPAAGCSRRAPSSTCCATTPATAWTATWECRCIAASARICAAPPTRFAASARWRRRGRSATAASGRRTAGRIPTRACRSLI